MTDTTQSGILYMGPCKAYSLVLSEHARSKIFAEGPPWLNARRKVMVTIEVCSRLRSNESQICAMPDLLADIWIYGLFCFYSFI